MVKCPVCGIERNSLYKHIRTHGYKCKEDFLKDYPSTSLFDESISDTLRDAQLKRYSDPKEREKISKSSKKLWENPEYREKSSKARVEGAKKQWQDAEKVKKRIESIREAQTNLWKDPEYRESQCKSFRDKWSDPEYRKKQLEGFKDLREFIREQDGKVIIARSSYEVTCTWYLDTLGLKYEYEKGPYEVFVPSENRVRYYYPDFYIESLNLFIEVKSRYFYNMNPEMVDLKLNTIRNASTYAVLVMEDELKDIESFIEYINTQCKKYGCADTLINPPQNGRS